MLYNSLHLHKSGYVWRVFYLKGKGGEVLGRETESTLVLDAYAISFHQMCFLIFMAFLIQYRKELGVPVLMYGHSSSDVF